MRVAIGRSKKVYTCSHVKIDYWDDGIDLLMFELDGIEGKNKTIEMPEDGRVVRLMNDQGKEINRLEWK